MAEILQNAFQKAFDEQGEMEDKKSQKNPTIDSVIGIGPDIIQPPKTEVKEVVSNEGVDAQEGPFTKAKVPELNQKLTQPVENDAATDASAAEAEATNDNNGTVSQREVSQPPSVDQMVLDLKRKVAVAAESKASDGTAEGSVKENKSSDATVLMSVKENKSSDGSAKGSVEENKSSDATNDNDGTVSQREVSQPPSVDQMVLDLKRKIAVAAESKSSDGTAEGSVEENKSSDATVLMSVKKTSHQMVQPKGLSKTTSHRMLRQ
jgi:hypothetical protein